MRARQTPCTPAALLLAAWAAFSPVLSRAAESSTEARLRDALRAATAQVQALEDEQARLQAADAAQKKELEALRAKLAAALAAPRPARPPDRELGEISRKLTDQAEASARLSHDLAQCQVATRECVGALQTREEQRGQLAGRLGPLNDRLSDCEARNARLFGVAKEILDRYQRIGLGEVIRAREPFLGAKQVQLENLAQGYEDKLLDQKVVPASRSAD